MTAQPSQQRSWRALAGALAAVWVALPPLACATAPSAADAGPDAADAGEPPDAGEAGTDWAPFSVLTLNLHCLRQDGTSFATLDERLRAVAQTAAAHGVGALALQEACVRGPVSAMAILERELETATGAAWSGTWRQTHTAWAGTADEAEEGVGVLARAAALPQPIGYRYTSQSGLARETVGARLPAALGGLWLFSVHLSFESAGARETQARESASLALSAAWPAGVLVAGDFNAREADPAPRALEAWGFRNLCAGGDAARIDHVFAHRTAPLRLLDAGKVFDGADGPVVSDHHGWVVRLGPGAPADATATRLVANHDAGSSRLYVRGSAAPLAWDRGWVAFRQASGVWRLVVTEAQGGFEYKWLRDDATWQAGGNSVAAAGAENATSPTF